VIRYSLICESGHGFEGWFRNSDDFETQRENGHLSCPACGTQKVAKRLMAPAVSTARGKENRQRPAETESADAAPAAAASQHPGEAAASATSKPALLPLDAQRQEVAAALRMLHAHVSAHAENVGSKFAEEARKIHKGETEERAIYGQTTPEDAETLIDEGIAIVPLPSPPDDAN